MLITCIYEILLTLKSNKGKKLNQN